MSIEINGLTSSKAHELADDTQLKRQSTEQTGSQEESGKSSTLDTVSISSNAAQLGKLDNTVVASPVVDTQRVEQVKQAISNGSFEIDPAKIADKLMQFESILKPKG